ncbi:unnamed protein product [Fusarium equiseti]|uniref:Uncharacterized protein n=1 Tax=Fusarium equiseti TaxID=61235 RepID=A0A8J2NQ78_FUSEQ|nr:unnamed protein product [Fusarium equiseti]
MAHIIEVFEFRKTFDRRLKRTVDGSWPHMCFLQNRPPKYWDTNLPCTYPACTKKDDDNWGSQYCVTIRPPMFGNDIHKPNFFHLSCFGLVADLNYLPHLHRLWPLNQLTWRRADMSLKRDNIKQFLEPAAQRLFQEFKGTYYDWCAERAGLSRKPEGSDEAPRHPHESALKCEKSFSDRFPKDPNDPRDFKLIPLMLE